MNLNALGTLKVTVDNISAVTAENVVATVVLPDSLTYDSATPTPDTQVGQTLTFNFASILASGQEIIEIGVIPTEVGTFTPTVSVTTTTMETNLANNNASVELTITADLSACSVVIPGPVAWDGSGGDCFECYAEGPSDLLNPLAGSGFGGNPWIISSGSVITNTPVSAIDDNRLCLTASSGARLMLPANWSTVRLGFRMTIDDNGAFGANPAGPRGYLGLLASPSAGLANGPVGSSCSNFVGYAWGGALFQGNGWNRATTPSVYYGTPGLYATTKVGGSSGNGSGLGILLSANPDIRPMVIIQIDRGNPSYTATLICVTGVNGLFDIPYADALVAMGSATPRDYLNSICGGTALNGYADLIVSGLTVDEVTNGLPNALVFGWEHSETTWRISEALFAYTTA